MAKRFDSEFTSIHNIDYIVEIHDSDFVGSAQPFALGAGGFSLSYAGDNNERWATIFASQIEFTFYVENAFHTSFEQDLIVNTEGRFSVKVYREGSLYWVGQILPDIVEILDQPTIHGRPMVIKATDGLGRLKDIDYNDNGTAYTGTETIIEHIFNILGKLNILSLMSTDCIKTSLGWRENSMTSGDQYALTRINHKAFIKVDTKGVLTYASCADVLKQILLAFNARIIQVDGCFYVIQVGKYIDNSMTVYAYDSAGAATGNESPVSFQQTDNASAGDMIRLSGGRFSYLPPLLFTKVNYKHFTTQNLSFERQISTGTTYNIVNVPAGARFFIFFSMQVETRLEFDVPADFIQVFVKYVIRISLGSYYYERKATMNERGVISYAKGRWTNTPADYEFFSSPVTTDGEPIYDDVIFSTLSIPDSGDLTIRVSFNNNYTILGILTGRTDFTRTTRLSDVYIEVITDGIIQDRVQTTTYEAKNANTDVSVGKTLEMVIGDGVEATTYGKLQVYDGASWVDSDNWTGLGESTPTPLLQLLANELMAGQAKPVQKIDSLWEATGYKANMSILYNSENYLPLQCRLDANRDDWSGEFFAVTRTLADADAQTPVKRLPSPADVIRRLDINREIPQPTPIVEPVVRQLGVVYVRDTDAIVFSSGDTVGNIPIVATAYDNTFLDGDPVYLVNNLTGQIQRFEVSGDVPAAATFLNVVPETADFDIIPGAVVIPDYGFQANRINSGGSSYFNQEWDNHMSSTLTWTENGGVLPATNTKAQIQLFQGQSKLREGVHYTISGSNFLIDANVHYDGAYYEAIVVI
jgi:hypothetical protein